MRLLWFGHLISPLSRYTALGWGNYLEDLIMNAQIAYSSGRAYVYSVLFPAEMVRMHLKMSPGSFLTITLGTETIPSTPSIAESSYPLRYPFPPSFLVCVVQILSAPSR